MLATQMLCNFTTAGIRDTAAFMQALGKVHLQLELANAKLLIQNVSYFVDLAKNTIVRNTQRQPKQVSPEEICQTTFNHHKLKKIPTLTYAYRTVPVINDYLFAYSVYLYC